MPANNPPLILDGAMGTELMDRGIKLPLPLWSAEANITNPSDVLSVHHDYINAGANIVTTNTFRSTSWSYRKTGLSPKRAQERAKLSLMMAVEAARSSKADLIAGSITAVEDCYRPDLFPGRSIAEDCYGETLAWFKEAEIDIILFETMGHIEEIEIALSFTSIFEKTWLSLILKDSSHLLSGHTLSSVYELINKKVDCLLLNCNTLAKSSQAITNLKTNWKENWGIYPNLGESEPEPDGTIEQKIDNDLFSSMISKFIDQSPAIIGSCCGSNPKHTLMIKKIIDNIY